MKLILKTAWCMFVCLLFALSANSYSQTLESDSEQLLTTTGEQETEVVPEGDTFESAIAQLNSSSFSDKAEAIEKLAALGDDRVLPILKMILEGELYTKKDTGNFITVVPVEDGYAATDYFSGADLGVVGSREAKKITVNNKLRGQLNSIIASLQLMSPDIADREQSVRNFIKDPNEDFRPLIMSALEKEESKAIRSLLHVALAMLDIEKDDPVARLQAVEILGGSVEPEAVAILNRLILKDDNGAYLETDSKVTKLAQNKLKLVNTKLSFYKFIEDLLFGFSLGSVLLLAAIGLAITFGVMGVINMAHGEMIMLGAYTTFAIQQLFPGHMEISLLLAIPAAFLVSGAAGVLIERLVIRHLYGRPLDTLLATFGISLILQQAVRMYRANNVPVVNPEWMSGFWSINGALSLTYNRIYILVFSLVVLFLLILLLKKTMFGLQMRAVTQNRPMANSMGIRSNWVDALTFGLGSGIAGIAGVALSQITNVGPNLGQSYIIDSFMVVVFGGVGNLMGTFVAAMSLGVVNKFLEPVTGAVIGKIIVLIFIILFIQWRPRGLFALKGRFVED